MFYLGIFEDGTDQMTSQPNSVSAAPALAVVVNGASQRVLADTLDALLGELGYGAGKVATAVNGEFIPASARSSRHLMDGDRIEIVSPRQGG